MEKRLVRCFAIGACLITLVCAARAQPSGRVVAIVVANTLDGEIGKSAASDGQNIDDLVRQDLKVTGGIPVQLFDVSGKDFKCATIEKILKGGAFRGQKLSIGPSDTVLFFYAGHGYNGGAVAQSSKFPTLMCSNLNQIPEPKKDLSLAGIVRQIGMFRPRLVIAVADACNESIFPGEFAIHKGLARPSADKLRQLFLGYRGTLIFSGAVVGEKSWFPDQRAGVSVFTGQFLTAYSDELTASANEERQPRWETIETAATATITPSEILPIPAVQQPQSNRDDSHRGLVYCGDACLMAGAGPAHH